MFSSSATPLRRTFLSTIRNSNNINQPLISLSATRSFSSTIRTMAEEKKGVHNLTSSSDWNDAKAGDELVVVDCFATWCGPCKVIAPQVVQFSDKYTDAKFYKLDVDEVPDVAQELGVRAMPTFYLFKKGEKVGEIVGANPKALESAIQANL